MPLASMMTMPSSMTSSRLDSWPSRMLVRSNREVTLSGLCRTLWKYSTNRSSLSSRSRPRAPAMSMMVFGIDDPVADVDHPAHEGRHVLGLARGDRHLQLRHVRGTRIVRHELQVVQAQAVEQGDGVHGHLDAVVHQQHRDPRGQLGDPLVLLVGDGVADDDGLGVGRQVGPQVQVDRVDGDDEEVGGQRRVDVGHVVREAGEFDGVPEQGLEDAPVAFGDAGEGGDQGDVLGHGRAPWGEA